MRSQTKVETPVCNESARSAALCELVVRLVNDSLVEYSYAAYVAELQYDLKATDIGFEVRFWRCRCSCYLTSWSFNHQTILLFSSSACCVYMYSYVCLAPHVFPACFHKTREYRCHC